MSLRIKAAAPMQHLETPGVAETPGTGGDDWGARLAKLVPAEALALYGAGITLANGRTLGLWVLAVVGFLLAGAVRYKATSEAGKPPQLVAIGVAMVSFLAWLLSLPAGSTPVPLGEHSFLASIFALCWTFIVPIFYKGD